MSPNEEQFDELLSAYLDGELTPEEQERVENRLVEDAECRRAFDELRTLRAELQSLPRYSLGKDFRQRVIDAAQEAAEKSSISSSDDEDYPLDQAPTPQPPPERGYRRGLAWSVVAITTFAVVWILENDQFDSYIEGLFGDSDKVAIIAEDPRPAPPEPDPANHAIPVQAPDKKGDDLSDDYTPVPTNTPDAITGWKAPPSIGPPPPAVAANKPHGELSLDKGELKPTVDGKPKEELASDPGSARGTGGHLSGLTRRLDSPQKEFDEESATVAPKAPAMPSAAPPAMMAKGSTMGEKHGSKSSRESGKQGSVDDDRVAGSVSRGGFDNSGAKFKDNFGDSLRTNSAPFGSTKSKGNKLAKTQPAVVVVNLICTSDKFDKDDLGRLAANRDIALKRLENKRGLKLSNYYYSNDSSNGRRRESFGSKPTPTSVTFVGHTTRDRLDGMLADLSSSSGAIKACTVAESGEIGEQALKYSGAKKAKSIQAPAPDDTELAIIEQPKEDVMPKGGAAPAFGGSAFNPPDAAPGSAPSHGKPVDVDKFASGKGRDKHRGMATGSRDAKTDSSNQSDDEPADDSSGHSAMEEAEGEEAPMPEGRIADGVIAGAEMKKSFGPHLESEGKDEEKANASRNEDLATAAPSSAAPQNEGIKESGAIAGSSDGERDPFGIDDAALTPEKKAEFGRKSDSGNLGLPRPGIMAPGGRGGGGGGLGQSTPKPPATAMPVEKKPPADPAPGEAAPTESAPEPMSDLESNANSKALGSDQPSREPLLREALPLLRDKKVAQQEIQVVFVVQFVEPELGAASSAEASIKANLVPPTGEAAPATSPAAGPPPVKTQK